MDKGWKNIKNTILAIKNTKCENPSKTLIAQSKEVCDYICVDMEEMYSFTKHLVAAKLFNKENITNFKTKFPTEEIKLATEAYFIIHKEKLETEFRETRIL